jgi:hypothetical protein
MKATNIHPKTSAAALGGSGGFLIVAILGSVHGVHLSPAADAAIPTFLSTLGAYLAPSPDAPDPVVVAEPAPAPVAGAVPKPNPDATKAAPVYEEAPPPPVPQPPSAP